MPHEEAKKRMAREIAAILRPGMTLKQATLLAAKKLKKKPAPKPQLRGRFEEG
jgi:hypothetical protein